MLDNKVNIERPPQKPLGAYLVEAGLISQVQLEIALKEQNQIKKCLGETLVEQGWIEQQTIEYFMKKVVLPEREAIEKKRLDLQKNSDRTPNSHAEWEALDPSLLSGGATREFWLPEIHLSARKTWRILFSIILGLIVTSAIAQFTQYFLPDFPLKNSFIRLFSVDQEANIPSLFSALALGFCSVLLAAIAQARKLDKNRFTGHWKALSIIFAFLALDELVSIHEITIDALRTALDASGFLYFTWVVPGAIFVIICGLAFLRFLIALPAKTRRLFLIAGTLYVGGALGMELIGGYYADSIGQQSLIYMAVATLEEFFEMLGIMVFIYALLSYLSSQHEAAKIRVSLTEV